MFDGRGWICVLLLLGFLSGGVIHALDEDSNPPNILFIVADDLGYEKLGCYGGLGTKTPNLNHLAREGARFARAYGSPVCTPTRMSVYTGQYPTRHGYTSVLPVHNGTKEAVDFKERFPSYAKQLREAGYLTSVTGKWQLATLELHPYHLKDAGFDSWCVWQIWKEGAKTTRYWDPCLNEDGKIRKGLTERFGPDVMARYVIKQMKAAVEAGKPFFIHHNMLLPHEPIVETPQTRRLGREASLTEMIRYMDRIIGGLVTAVDDMGIAEDTCIVFLGDNGTDTVGQVRTTRAGLVRGGKRTLNEGGTHLPLIVRWPGRIEAGTVRRDLVDVVDLFPTFCEIAGAKLPEEADLDGVSLVPCLLRGEAVGRKVTVAGFRKKFSVFSGSWRVNSAGVIIDARDLPREKIVSDEELSAGVRRSIGKMKQHLEMLP
ncbi:MAG: sulfatase-like hydrolase/transferase [Verrucomicrobiales bacterium]|nr:sulfatase-like hydrolase/transferase [Verrucomicrobiales bacterium]